MSGFGTTMGNTLLLNGTYTENTIASPGTVIPIVKPGTDLVIKMYREDQVDTGSAGVWDAASILAVGRQSL
jgi:hypothetical protein